MIETYYKFNRQQLKFETTRRPKINYIILLSISMAMSIVMVALCSKNVKTSRQQSELISELMKDNETLRCDIDMITNDCNYENVIKAKAGEYAMHPHKLKNCINEEALAEVLIAANAWYPDIKMAQIQMESSMGKSNIAKEANNVCSMRVTTNRETTQLKGQSYRGFGVYNNWESCVIDMILWDYSIFRKKTPTRSEYLDMLQSIYSESPTYSKTIAEQSKKYQKYFK